MEGGGCDPAGTQAEWRLSMLHAAHAKCTDTDGLAIYTLNRGALNRIVHNGVNTESENY